METKVEKPIKPKPQFYAVCLLPMQEIAKEKGYNLIVHGSLNRDMDLIAVPWVDKPAPEMELIKALELYLNGCHNTYEEEYLFTILPGGRRAYVININRGGKHNGYQDAQYYLDISITALPAKQLCPKCNGEGYCAEVGTSSNTARYCPVCKGEKLI